MNNSVIFALRIIDAMSDYPIGTIDSLLPHGGSLSDDELAEKLNGFPPLTMEDFPDLEDVDYKYYLKSHSGCLPDGLEKWL